MQIGKKLKRLQRHQTWERKIKKLVQKLANMESCPLGKQAISGWYRYEKQFEALDERHQTDIMERVRIINEPYFREDENGYSGYDMDQLMLKGA